MAVNAGLAHEGDVVDVLDVDNVALSENGKTAGVSQSELQRLVKEGGDLLEKEAKDAAAEKSPDNIISFVPTVQNIPHTISTTGSHRGTLQQELSSSAWSTEVDTTTGVREVDGVNPETTTSTTSLGSVVENDVEPEVEAQNTANESALKKLGSFKDQIDEKAHDLALAKFNPRTTNTPNDKQILEILNLGDGASKELKTEAVNAFRQSYEGAYEAKFMEMAWAKRMYYTATRAVDGVVGGVTAATSYVFGGKALQDLKQVTSNIAHGTESAFNKVSPGLGTSLINGIKNISGLAKDAVSGIYNALRHPIDTVSNLGSVLTKAGHWIASAVSASLKAVRWVADTVWHVGGHVVKGAVDLASWALKKAAWVVTHPAEALKAVVNFGIAAIKLPFTIARMALELGYKALVGTIKGIAYAIANPVEALKAVGRFAGHMCDSLGLTDIWQGMKSFYKGMYHLVTGNPIAAKRELLNSVRAVKGALIAVGEFTGISDAGRAVYHLCKGNLGQAALYAGLATVGIVSLCTTFGIGNFMTTAAKTAAVAGAKVLAKDAAKEVTVELAKKLTKEVLVEKSGKIAGKALEETGSLAAKEVTPNAVSKIAAKHAEPVTEEMLREAGAKELVSETTQKSLTEIAKSSKKELAETLVASGMKAEEAEFTARCLKKALGKGSSAGKHDGILKKAFEDEITAAVHKDIMDRGMREGFEDAFKKGIREIGKKHGLSDEAIEKLEKAGIEGFEEGVEKAVRKVVREGVEDAFKKFRERRISERSPYQRLEELAKRNHEPTNIISEDVLIAERKKVESHHGPAKKTEVNRGNRNAATGEYDLNATDKVTETGEYAA